MVFTTEGFLEVAIESWPDLDYIHYVCVSKHVCVTKIGSVVQMFFIKIPTPFSFLLKTLGNGVSIPTNHFLKSSKD